MPRLKLDDPSTAVGASISQADSSLRNFSIRLGDGRGIILEAVDDDGEPSIEASLVSAEELPDVKEAVCSVDWSWIYGSKVSKLTLSSKMVRIYLEPVGPLTISVAVWQSSPFLSFQPFKPAK